MATRQQMINLNSDNQILWRHMASHHIQCRIWLEMHGCKRLQGINSLHDPTMYRIPCEYDIAQHPYRISTEWRNITSCIYVIIGSCNSFSPIRYHAITWTNADFLSVGIKMTWWRHQMETFSALLAICAGNSPVTGEVPAQRLVTRSFDVFFDLRLNKRLSKQSWGWWFETLSRPLWRHFNEFCLCE